LVAVAFAGCVSFCEPGELVRAAARGDPAAIDELAELGRPKIPSSARPLPKMEAAFLAIRPSLDSSDPYLRELAVDALRRLSERAREIPRDRHPDLFDGPLGDRKSSIRWRAAWAMGRIGMTSAALRKAANDPQDGVAEMACWALGEARDRLAGEALTRALERGPVVRTAAARALGRVRGERDVAPVVSTGR
jgi:HEAT repeat protein